MEDSTIQVVSAIGLAAPARARSRRISLEEEEETSVVFSRRLVARNKEGRSGMIRAVRMTSADILREPA
jgi:hypothetical protein